MSTDAVLSLRAEIVLTAVALVIYLGGAFFRAERLWGLIALAGIAAAVTYLGLAWVLDVRELRALLRRIRGVRR